jgi:nucleoside diphosphate kinase
MTLVLVKPQKVYMTTMAKLLTEENEKGLNVTCMKFHDSQPYSSKVIRRDRQKARTQS